MFKLSLFAETLISRNRHRVKEDILNFSISLRIMISIFYSPLWVRPNLSAIAWFVSTALLPSIVYDLSIWGSCGFVPESKFLHG